MPNRRELLAYLKFATENRLQILAALDRDPMRVSDVERVLGIANATRELKALEGLGLIQRSGDYYYRLTGAGEWVVRRQLARIQAFIGNIALFNKYDWGWVPRGMEPSPILQGEQLRKGSHANIIEFENAVTRARVHLSRMVERPLLGRALPELDKLSLDEVRIIWSAEAIAPALASEVVATLEQARAPVRISLLERVPVVMSLNSTRSYLFLHERDGDLDANTLFVSDNPDGLEWCRKVFDDYERRATLLYDSRRDKPAELPVKFDSLRKKMTGVVQSQ